MPQFFKILIFSKINYTERPKNSPTQDRGPMKKSRVRECYILLQTDYWMDSSWKTCCDLQRQKHWWWHWLAVVYVTYFMGRALCSQTEGTSNASLSFLPLSPPHAAAVRSQLLHILLLSNRQKIQEKDSGIHGPLPANFFYARMIEYSIC